MDFANPAAPQVRRLPFSPQHHGLCLFSVHTGGSHADLTEQYAAIPAEMKAVAACFGQQALRQVPEDAFWAEAGKLRGQVPDRALLRAAHFFEEDRRAAAMSDALAQNDIPQILALFSASGRSSQQLLQNAWPDAKPEERGISLALLLSSHLLQSKGACRIHGGGFAGSILGPGAAGTGHCLSAGNGSGIRTKLLPPVVRPSCRRGGNFVVANEISVIGKGFSFKSEM